MPKDEEPFDRKLDSLTKSVKDVRHEVAGLRSEFKNDLAEHREELKSFLGFLAEETNAKLDLIIEALNGLRERLDRDIAEIREEIEQMHMIFFGRLTLSGSKLANDALTDWRRPFPN